MRKLGSRQREVVEAARDGKASAHHVGQGRFVVYVPGRLDPINGDVLERLFDLGLVEHGAEIVSGYMIRATAAGVEAVR